MESISGVIVAGAALLAALSAVGARALPAYAEQRRVLPVRVVVAAALAALGAGTAVAGGGALLSQALMALWMVVLALVAVIDYETHRIPNVIIVPAIALALTASTADPRLTWQGALLGALLGFAILYALARLTRGAIGAGDVKLATFLGAITGFPGVLYALAFGFLALGLAAALLLALRRVERRTVIPYGPALALGGAIAMIVGRSP